MKEPFFAVAFSEKEKKGAFLGFYSSDPRGNWIRAFSFAKRRAEKLFPGASSILIKRGKA